jgi:2-amino-4-hydroxy-6-hydroxymethyldihydropteridine diphosphokinase
MSNVFISIGSNLGNKYQNIKSAISKLKKLGKILEISSLYITSPLENKNQPYFYNCVVEINTKLKPKELLKKIKEIEKNMGRKESEKRYQPRIIDLDILFYGKKIVKSKTLTIPHKKLHQRKFVLWPLAEIAPNFIHPVLKKTIKKIKDELRDPSQRIWLIRE